jgi:hypothetical protein
MGLREKEGTDMRRVALFTAAGLAILCLALTPQGDLTAQGKSNPKVIDSRLSIGANAIRASAGQPPVLDLADPVAGIRVLQVRADTSLTYPFVTFEHRTTVTGTAVTKYDWKIDSSGNLILRDSIAGADRMTVDFANGGVTFAGRLMVPMGEVSYFDTTGTSVTVPSQSDGSTNMVVVPVVTTGNFDHEFDNGGADNGRLRYTGTTTKTFHVALTWSAVAATAGDKFVLAAAKNGTPIAASKVIQTFAGANVNGNAIHVMTTLATNQYLELYVGNLTAGRDLTVENLNIFAMGM